MKKAEKLTFRWNYIILPLAVFALAIIAAAYFYHLLPPEVAYHFEFDGSPDEWLSRVAIIAWMLVPQLILTLVAAGLGLLITKLNIVFGQIDSTGIKPERIISLMCSIIALPQIVLLFAMLYIFSYNSYQIRILPMWLFMLIILGLVTIALAIFIVLFIIKAKQKIAPQLKDLRRD